MLAEISRRVARALGPAVARPPRREVVRATIEAGIGIAALAVFDRYALPLSPALQLAELPLLAPLAATAFLVFAVPNSPLAQPWSVVVGNTLSALIGIAIVTLVPQPILAGGLAIGIAVAAMMLLRAMHPPGGAMALAMVLGDDSVRDAGFAFALAPIMVSSVLLVVLATLYNRTTGRVYPFRQPAERSPLGTADRAPGRRLGLSAEALTAILQRLNLAANIGPEDLARLISAAEAEATARRFGGLTCADLMSRDLVTIPPDTSIDTMAGLFHRRRFKTLPVIDADGSFRGIVRAVDLVAYQAQAWVRVPQPGLISSALQVLRPKAEARDAAGIMTTTVPTLAPESPIAPLLLLMADGHQQAVPVVQRGRLLGLITRSDLITGLAHTLRTG
ncbi:MAG: HPP family protein [Pseudorhodobacter sp.]|nr:HPP family protein [Pseudorhodobacter sp.]